MNNPNDNKSADGNWGKKVPSVGMKPISKRDEREIADYVKHQPQSLGSHKAHAKKKDMAKKMSYRQEERHERNKAKKEGKHFSESLGFGIDLKKGY